MAKKENKEANVVGRDKCDNNIGGTHLNRPLTNSLSKSSTGSSAKSSTRYSTQSSKKSSTKSSKRFSAGRRRAHSKKQEENAKIAKAHMIRFFELSKEVYKKDTSLANRYITLGRKVAMKFNLRIPSEYKRLFCKHCYKFMMPGIESRVRVHEGRLIYFCKNCGRYWRLPLSGRRERSHN